MPAAGAHTGGGADAGRGRAAPAGGLDGAVAGAAHSRGLCGGLGGRDGLCGAAPLAAAAATTAAQAQLAQIGATQQQLAAQLATLDTPLLFSVQRVYNGMAVLADAEQRAALAQLPGVLAVHPLIPKLPDNSASIPYLGIPALWQGGVSLALPDGLRAKASAWR